MDGVEMSLASGRPVRTVALRESSDTLTDARELHRRAHDDGYLYFSRLVPRDPLRLLQAMVTAECRERGFMEPGARLGAHDDSRWVNFLCAVSQSPLYRRLARIEPLMAVLQSIFGTSPRAASGDLCRVVSPGTPDLTTRPHQDAGYIPDAPGLWTLWMPLGDCPRELGPLCVLPESHRGGLMHHESGVRGVPGLEGATWATGDLDSGDVLLFSGLTVHRALDNTTADRVRLSLDYRYVPAAG